MREKKPQLASFVLIGVMLASIFAGAASGAGVGGAEEGIDYPIVSNLKAQSADNPLTITLTPVADATVKSWQPESYFGSESVLSLSYSAIDEVREAVTLLRFDVTSAIPSNAIIDSAVLELFLVDGVGADPAPVAAHFVTSSWAENSVTWNSFPTAEPIGVISQVDRSPGSYKSWWVTSFAQEWQSGSNDGVYLRGPVDGTYYERTFESHEHSEMMPRLVVTYHLPSPTYTFTGSVYQGMPPDTSTPASGVTVGLWGDEDEWPEAGFERVPLASTTTTSDAGEFSLSWEEGDTHYPYLHVIEVDPAGAYSTGAQAEEPGNVTNFNVVSYPDIPPGTYGGITFWDQMPAENPDLVITEIQCDWGNNRTGYVVKNIGNAVAPAGYYTTLIYCPDNCYSYHDFVDVDLTPGESYHGWFHVLPCDIEVIVCADTSDVVEDDNLVEESNEENNCIERICECLPEEKPDLAIIDVWDENGTICYLIENIGEAVAPGGHCTALSVDGVYRVEDCVEENIAPGAGMERCFEYGWECSPPEDAVVVCADHRGVLEEREEENNCVERVFECLPKEKPDLVITDLWNEEGRICYQIRNIGDGVAPEGHRTALIINDEYMVSDPVDQELEHGERLRGCFDYDWECTSPEDIVVVVADHEEGVAEDNETNNHREEIWRCDVIPPQIIQGPIVQEETRESAVIVWETDEDSDSIVRYGKTARLYDLEEGDSAMVIEHSITLSRLEASTTYNFVVQSTDASGNTVVSDELTFETAPLPDGEDPTVVIVDPGVCQGIVAISAEAEDNIGVEKVEFYLGDKLVFTDYSPPYELSLDTAKYENGEYALETRAYDIAGRYVIDERIIRLFNVIDVTIPSVNIITPSQGDTVSGTITVKALVSDDEALSHGYFWVGPDPKMHYASWWTGYPSPKEATIEMNWNTKGSKNGPLRIAWEIYDKKGNVGWGYRDVKVDNVLPPAPPKLTITNRNIKRNNNYFTISLTVKNVGGQTATSITIWDYLQLFQPIDDSDSIADYQSEFNHKLMRWKVEINSKVDIPKGGERTYTYDVVPVMTPKSAGPYISCPKPMIGAYATCGVGWWKWEGETHLQYQQPGGIGYFHEWKNQGKLVKDIFVATHEADYLIVTNPSQLFSHNQGNEDDVNALLSEMAQLAKHRNGVLGYLDFTDRNKFRNLIKPGMPWTKANWAYRLHPDFSKPVKGYLLIVGEVEIVPAWLRAEWNLKWSNWKCITREVDITDLPYADTGGNNGAPELIVGRIIGNTAADLATAIQTSNRVYEKYPGYSFNRSDALLVSGIDSNSNIQKSFTNFVDDTEKIINKEFTVHKLHWSGVGVVASQRVPQFRNNASNNDVICYQGHGGPDAWVPLNTIDFPGKPFATPPLPPINFGSTNPLVLGLACLTGSYEDHTANAPCGDFDGGDDNIAEAFFDHGAAVYIGSTEVSPISHNCEAGKVFFKKWWKPYTTIGKALTDLKRDRWSHGTVWQFWVTEYNLYGDPKFGAAHPGTVATAPFQKTSLEPVASLDVVVPDYEVTTRDGVDYVEIPGGDVLLEEGEYRIPYYSVSIEYPTGYKVQDVVLTDMSGMVTDTGLNIPTITNLIAFLGDKSSPVSGVDDGWVPAQGNYRWEILENPDGTSILVIIMYPFYYNPLTTDVRFYKNYSFDINYTVSPVAITTLTTDRNEYQQGDTVMVDIELNNSGDAQNAIVSASVKRYGSGDTVDGLLLRTLKDFEGIASFSSRWDSSGFDPGYYYMEVALKDTNGNVLDRQTEMFRLGISSGEITNFTATPEYFGIGDEIEINMTFNNTGTVNITGRAVIKIGNSTGGIVKEFRHNVTDLTLSESISFIDTWNTSGAEEGSYNIIGYVLYDSKATIPVTATICSCVIPTDDLYINSDTTLCPGFYNIPDSGADGVIIINASNIVLGCNGATLNGDGSGFGIYNPGFDNVTIKNGNVLNYEIGIHLSGSDSSIISNNTVSQSSTQGISIESSHYCNVYDNCVSFSGDRGIVFGGGGNNAVYNNIVYNNSAYGAIEAISSDNNEIYNNTAYFNQWGIATNHGSNNLICDNTIYGNELGVYLDWPSTNNRVFNNDISSNNEGIWTNHNSTDNIIAGNIIFSNEYAGIHIETDNNTVTNNTANNNRIGLYLCADSTGNTVNYNTFCNNSWYDVRDEDSNSGDENICDLTDNWNDAGTTGCTYTCIGKPDLKISDLKGPDWSKYVGKEVTVEGIFVRDPLPMLVTDLDIVRVNMPMPDDQYILLIGNEAEEIDPRRYGGAKLRLKGLVTEIDDSSKYGDEYVAIESISYEMLERLEEYAPEIVHIEAYPEQ